MRKSIIPALLALLVLVLPAYAGEIHTRDGKVYKGDIRFMDGGTVVILHDGQSTTLQNSDIVQLTMADAAKPGSQGLLGEYFQSPDLRSRRRALRIDPQINFTWPQGQPIVPSPQGDQNPFRDQYSVRWTGQVRPMYSEQYTFSTSNSGNVHVWVNNQKIFDVWNGGRGSGSGQIALQAGKRYDIRIEYQNTGGDGQIQLLWTSPHQGQETIPPTCLFPPSNTDIQIGDGLQAEYFANPDLTNRVNTHIESMINWTWGGNVVAGIRADGPFSVKWTGYIKPQSAGNYTFYTQCNGGVQLTVDGINVIDDWKTPVPRDHGTFAFTSDKKVKITLQYSHTSGRAMVGLTWSAGNPRPENVPTWCLFSEDKPKGQGQGPQVIVSSVSDVPAPSSGVMLSDGSIIAATPVEVDFHGAATLHWQQKDLTVPAERIAMIFADQSTVQDDYAWPADRGALLRNGDFVEGGIVSFKNGQVRVSSVIFGLKDYSMGDLRAVLLKKPAAVSTGFMVRRNDGSAYAATALTFKSNAVVVETDVLGQITINAGDIYSIKSLK